MAKGKNTRKTIQRDLQGMLNNLEWVEYHRQNIDMLLNKIEVESKSVKNVRAFSANLEKLISTMAGFIQGTKDKL